jgi:hypothetical protein
VVRKGFNKYWRTIKIIGYIGILIVLLFLPPDYFDNGTSICVSKRWFDIECYGCGMTRAIMHMIHIDFQEAWNINKLSFIVLPLLGLLWTKLLLKEFNVHILKWF